MDVCVYKCIIHMQIYVCTCTYWFWDLGLRVRGVLKGRRPWGRWGFAGGKAAVEVSVTDRSSLSSRCC